MDNPRQQQVGLHANKADIVLILVRWCLIKINCFVRMVFCIKSSFEEDAFSVVMLHKQMSTSNIKKYGYDDLKYSIS